MKAAGLLTVGQSVLLHNVRIQNDVSADWKLFVYEIKETATHSIVSN